MTEQRLDPSEVEQLWAQHSDAVRRFLLGVLKDRDAADEALQQAFVSLLERGHTSDPESRRGWLFRVAYHHAMEGRRRQTIGARALRSVGAAIDADEVTAREQPDRHAMRGESIDATRRAIAGLPPAQRQIVELRMRDGLTFAVIAAQLGIPLSTALTRMRLAIDKLRDALE